MRKGEIKFKATFPIPDCSAALLTQSLYREQSPPVHPFSHIQIVGIRSNARAVLESMRPGFKSWFCLLAVI